VCGVFFDETPLTRPSRPPRIVYVLRAFGFFGVTLVVFAAIANEPHPALHGEGLAVLMAILVFAVGVVASIAWRPMPRGVRFAGLLAVGVAGGVMAAIQPFGAAVGCVYFVFAIAELRLVRPGANLVAAVALGAQLIAIVVAGDDVAETAGSLLLLTLPWYFVLRLMREVRMRQTEAEGLVEELRESRAAEAQAAALGERARVARDMHDVLAHSLSALALQLEAARLLARDRGSDPEVVAAIETAHRLAAGGLDDARRSISALRGDALPGPDGLPALVEAFGERARLVVTGEPRPLDSEARLAIYRTAQEALTNVRKHSAADRVDVGLAYAQDGTTLTVSDHGPGAPVLVGESAGGYGLTGMRERAELLGGRLRAEPTADGFRVELWLP
jgi:signal transduction histidine kinase